MPLGLRLSQLPTVIIYGTVQARSMAGRSYMRDKGDDILKNATLKKIKYIGMFYLQKSGVWSPKNGKISGGHLLKIWPPPQIFDL
jgi:hypothetical protein